MTDDAGFMPPIHARIDIAGHILMPPGVPRTGWCVIGKDSTRGTVLAARNGSRLNLHRGQYTWDGKLP